MRFSKYSATGNDFILIDDRALSFPVDDSGLIRRLCARRTGIGADGLILLQPGDKLDFRMRYFNADGLESEMCGNGARSILDFARGLGSIGETARFETMLSSHAGRVNGHEIHVQLNTPANLKLREPVVAGPDYDVGGYVEIGVPHYVLFCPDVAEVDVAGAGRLIAHHDSFPKGTNVNFVSVNSDRELSLRTYERGVEAETLACGTGAGASAYIALLLGRIKTENPTVLAPGGVLRLRLVRETGEIWLSGTVEQIFSGELNTQLMSDPE